MTNKTKEIHFRVTPEQYDDIVNRSIDFRGITHFIMSAIKEFSNRTVKTRMDATMELWQLYKSMNVHLGHIGGNLNQAMHRLNEMAIAGTVTSSYFNTEVLPIINEVKELCISLQKRLYEISDKYTV